MRFGEVLSKLIDDADMILVGIGKEMEAKESDYKTNLGDSKIIKSVEEDKKLKWLLPFIDMRAIQKTNFSKINEAYEKLSQLLCGKNYFIITLATDDIIYRTSLDEKRIVAPCGNNKLLQCSEKCSNLTKDIDLLFWDEIDSFMNGEQPEINIEQPLCTQCGKPLVPNKIPFQPYTEFYLGQWEVYTKWLQGTLNKKIVILELGVGLEFPSVIRWPYEKVAFYNNKATLIRVHSQLPQLAEEIKEKGHSIQSHPIDFLIN